MKQNEFIYFTLFFCQDDSWSHLQRAEALHGNEPEAFRRMLSKVQDGQTKGEGEAERARRLVDKDRNSSRA